MNAKVYVGTYAKYNSGSLSGKWISLKNCKSYSDFIQKCREAHEDEDDPEFMIQDTEDFPEGLDCLEWLSENDFNDIKKEISEELQIIDYSEKALAVVGDTKAIKEKLKKLGGRFNSKLSCGAGWIFPKKALPKVQELIDGNIIENSDSGAGNTAVFKDNLKEFLDKNTDRGYLKKCNMGAVKISNGWFYLLEKKNIKNRFCFRDEGPSYDFYKSLISDDKKMKQYFIDENIGGLEKEIEKIDKNRGNIILMRNNSDYNGLSTCFLLIDGVDDFRFYNFKDNETFKPTSEDVQNILDGTRFQYDQFKKRLETYLKKYGISKLDTWTYWENA